MEVARSRGTRKLEEVVRGLGEEVSVEGEEFGKELVGDEAPKYVLGVVDLMKEDPQEVNSLLQVNVSLFPFENLE